MSSESNIKAQEVSSTETNETETPEKNKNITSKGENLTINRFEKLKELQSLIKKESAMKELCKKIYIIY
jgi:hypothetical protein